MLKNHNNQRHSFIDLISLCSSTHDQIVDVLDGQLTGGRTLCFLVKGEDVPAETCTAPGSQDGCIDSSIDRIRLNPYIKM